MPKERPTEAEVVEALRVLSGTLEHTNSYLEMISDTLEQIRSEVSWLIDNREEVFPLMVRAMPLDPCDPKFGEKLAKLNEDPPVEEKPTTPKKTTLF